jgi:hypothetical protein
MSPESAAEVLTTKKFTAADRLILSSSDFIAGFVPPNYLLDGILQQRFIYSLTGRTGAGKTAIILLIAASVALGRSIGTRQAHKGRVLYLAGENPDDIRMRWIAMAQNMDFDLDEIDVHFIAGTFKISAMIERIEAEAKKVGPFTLVIVDTSAAFFEGEDENSNSQQGVHARRLRGLVSLPGKPSVIVATHPPKNASDDNMQPRGGGAFIAEMDGNLCAINHDGIVELHWQGKFRGPDFAPLSFQLRGVTHECLKDSLGRTIPTVVATHVSEDAQNEIEAAARGNENLVLAAYAEQPDASYAEQARTISWVTSKGDPEKMKVQRAVKKLVQAKLMAMERGKPVVTDKGAKALSVVTAKAGKAAT